MIRISPPSNPVDLESESNVEPNSNSLLIRSDAAICKARNGDSVDEMRTIKKVSSLLTISLPMIISVLVAMLNFRGYSSSGLLYHWAIHYRAQTQVVIHVLTTLLSLPWVFGLCSTLNLYVRSYLQRKSLPLLTARLWTAASQGRLQWNLPWRNLLIGILWFVITLLPSWLWTGALTPQLTMRASSMPVVVMSGGPGAWPLAQGYSGLSRQDCPQSAHSADNFGSSTFCPGIHTPGALLDSIGSAITANGSPRNHTKADTTGFSYFGRSYGVGASAGWPFSHSNSLETLQMYHFQEPGYLTSADCSYNSSSLWVLGRQEVRTGPFAPNLFRAHGWLPNSNYTYKRGLTRAELQKLGPLEEGDGHDGYAQLSFGAGENIVSIGGTNNMYTPGHFLAFAAGQAYSNLDTVQCAFTFTPQLFNVTVHETNRTIVVNPVERIDEIEPRGALREKILRNVVDIAKVETTLYSSTVGNAFNKSITTLSLREHIPVTPELVLHAVEQSLLAATDDIMVQMASTSMALDQGARQDTATTQQAAVAIGDRPFIVATMVIHLVAFVGVFTVTLHNRFWKGISPFDFADIPSMCLGAYDAGRNASHHAHEDPQLGQFKESGGSDASARTQSYPLFSIDSGTLRLDFAE